MKKTTFPSVVIFGVLLGTTTLLSGILSSCADKMTDRHSEMAGGIQGDPHPGVKNLYENGTPANTDGTGKAIAAGNVNTTPDSMWNQSSPAGQKPF